MSRRLTRICSCTVGVVLALLLVSLSGSAGAQEPRKFGDLAEGPYKRLVIREAMVVPGHGGPPVGPYDIVIEGNKIADMIPFDPVTVGRRGKVERATGDRVIEARGMYVMPGMIDLHMHVRQEPMEIEYVYYLKLAHGVTTLVPVNDRGIEYGVEQARLAAENKILAPRLYPFFNWGDLVNYDRDFLEDPANAPKIAKEMVAKGARVVNPPTWNRDLFGAICKSVWEAGGITTKHLPPSTNAVIDAVEAARLGVTMIEHHYAYAESALDRTVQDFPADYNYNNENHRFRHAGVVWEEADRTARERLLTDVAQKLVDYGVTMLPTRVVYEANRDLVRAGSLPWHEKYTHQALVNWNGPNPSYHGAYHYDWTSRDEQSWYVCFDLWGDLIYEFNKRGGRVAYGTDDSYLFATPGFSNVRELQLVLESGMHTLEVIKTATLNSALTLREPKLGLVQPGYLADLVIVDGNPAYNLRFLYSFGALTLDRNGKMIRTKGIIHTIKDGIVTENARLMEEVERMVAKSKEGVAPSPLMEPFAIRPR